MDEHAVTIQTDLDRETRGPTDTPGAPSAAPATPEAPWSDPVSAQDRLLSSALSDSLISSGQLALAAIQGDQIAFASSRLRKLLRIRVADTDRGMTWQQFLHPDDRPRVIAELLDAQGQERQLVTECRLAARFNHARVRIVGWPGHAGAHYLCMVMVLESLREWTRGPALTHAPDAAGPAPDDAGTVLDQAAAVLRDAWQRSEPQAVLSIAVQPLAGESARSERAAVEAAVVGRLRPALRRGDLIGSLPDGGLLAVAGKVQGPAEAALLAGRLLELMTHPLNVQGRLVAVRMNIGTAMYPHDDHHLAGLLERAGDALKRALLAGLHRFALAQASHGILLDSHPVDWNDELRLGSATLDAQHGQMLQTMNCMLDDIRSASKLPALRAKGELLMRLLHTDFVVEERLMSEHGTPGAEAHMAQHRALMRDLRYATRADFALGTLLHIRLVSDWIRHHIPDFDAPLLTSV